MRLFVVLLSTLAVALCASAQHSQEYFTHAFDMKCSVCQMAVTGVKEGSGDIATRLSQVRFLTYSAGWDFNKYLMLFLISYRWG
jgi:hypothetical protein